MKDIMERIVQSEGRRFEDPAIAMGEKLEKDLKNAGVKDVKRSLDEINIRGKNYTSANILWNERTGKMQISAEIKGGCKADAKSIVAALKKMGFALQ